MVSATLPRVSHISYFVRSRGSCGVRNFAASIHFSQCFEKTTELQGVGRFETANIHRLLDSSTLYDYCLPEKSIKPI